MTAACEFQIDSLAPVDLDAADGAGGDLNAPLDQAGDLFIPPDLTVVPEIVITRDDFVGEVNLTTEGMVDWAHYGLTMATDVDQKSMGGSMSLSVIGTPGRSAGYAISSTWTDGTPTTSATMSPTGIYVQGVGSGFTLTVPAGPVERVLRIYCAQSRTSMTLTAHLANGIIPDQMAVYDVPGNAYSRYNVVFRSPTMQSLVVTRVISTINSSPSSGDLMAVTLE
jgi:hypothetical protein